MVRKDLIARANAILREHDARKPVSIPKHVFHISDDSGNIKDFAVKSRDKSVIYVVDDVDLIFDALLAAVYESIRNGEEVSIRGFGTLGMTYMKPRVVRNVLDNEKVEVPGHYVPKFFPGNDLRRCVQAYEQTLEDRKVREPLPIFSEAAEDPEGD